MASDTREALLSEPGVRHARVVLDDHQAPEEINAGMAEGRGFGGTFPGETEGENLDEPRGIFRRKSLLGRQERLCREHSAAGSPPGN